MFSFKSNWSNSPVLKRTLYYKWKKSLKHGNFIRWWMITRIDIFLNCWYKRDYSGIKFSIVFYCNPYLARNLVTLKTIFIYLFIYLLGIIDGYFLFGIKITSKKNKRYIFFWDRDVYKIIFQIFDCILSKIIIIKLYFKMIQLS